MIGHFERSALQEKKTMYTKYCEKSTKITEEISGHHPMKKI